MGAIDPGRCALGPCADRPRTVGTDRCGVRQERCWARHRPRGCRAPSRGQMGIRFHLAAIRLHGVVQDRRAVRLAATIGMVALAGCPMPRAKSELIEAGANVPLLPNGLPAPEPCPEIARTVMDALQLKPGDNAKVEIDANQFEREPLTVQAGPIESIMLEGMGKLGGASRLYGRVWTSGPRV